MPLHLFAKFLHLGDLPVRHVLAADIPRHVGEVEDLLGRMPDRPLGEREAGRQLLDLDVRIDELCEFLGLDVNGHAGSFPRFARTGANLTDSATLRSAIHG